MNRLQYICVFSLSLLLGGCLPGTGHLELYGDAGLAPSAEGAMADATPIQPDAQAALQQDGAIPNHDVLGQDSVGFAPPPQPDLMPPPPPQPDTGPPGPQPPFGNAVGMTAANFQNIPDCSGTPHSLHAFFGQKKGVLIAMMSPS
jgi:hypothetical protein